MVIVYAEQPFPKAVTKSLFLAGPTPRGEGASWRDQALQLLQELEYDGHVFVPEPIDGEWAEDYADQVEWEREALERADVIAFWVPRDLAGTKAQGSGAPMPGLTTNDEWGFWKDSGKVVWGAPAWADNTRYQTQSAKELGVPLARTLEETLSQALKKIGEGAERSHGGELVPLHIWSRDDFQAWYGAQTRVGHELRGFRVPWTCWAGPKKDKLVLYGIQPRVWIAAEDREKEGGEIVVLRSDISAVCRPRGPVAGTRIVLAREYRLPVRNEDGFVWELPSGSSPKPGADPLQTAVEELSEEVGLTVAKARLRPHGGRQMGATLVGYHAHLFSVELTASELEKLSHDKAVHGANDDERVTLRVCTLQEIVENRLVDWPMLGMIFEALVSGHAA